MSLNKHTPGCEVYVFDNSDKEPYVNKFPNVKVLDNTKGQIINFDKWLEKYPKRNASGAKVNNWASAKHCYTIDKLMDIIGDNFVLMDSDVIVLKDIRDIVDESCIFCAEVMTQPYPGRGIQRVLPYICYINVRMCKEKGVRYFNENYMHGLHYTAKNLQCDVYDTGANFYREASKFRYKTIKCDDYIAHYKAGSWEERKFVRSIPRITPEAWMEKYKVHWSTEKKKKVIYTCISGPYDALRDPKFINSEYDYICFTDQKFVSNVWEIRPLPAGLEGLTQVKKQRKVKTCPHLYLKEYDFSVWVDANIDILGSVEEYVKANCPIEKGVFAVGEHPQRKCIYDEAEACVKLKKDTREHIDPQMARYRAEGFPKNYGLPQTCIVFRYHNDPRCIRLDETWWAEIEKGSHRDQLSFNYASWKNQDVKINYLDKNIFRSKSFRWAGGHRFKPTTITNTPPVTSTPLVSKVTKPAEPARKTPPRPTIRRWNAIQSI
jgi:hypothetical protein